MFLDFSVLTVPKGFTTRYQSRSGPDSPMMPITPEVLKARLGTTATIEAFKTITSAIPATNRLTHVPILPLLLPGVDPRVGSNKLKDDRFVPQDDIIDEPCGFGGQIGPPGCFCILFGLEGGAEGW